MLQKAIIVGLEHNMSYCLTLLSA